MRFESLPEEIFTLPAPSNRPEMGSFKIAQMSAWGCRVGHISYVISKDHMHSEMGYMASWHLHTGNASSSEQIGEGFSTLQAAEAACRRHARGQ